MYYNALIFVILCIHNKKKKVSVIIHAPQFDYSWTDDIVHCFTDSWAVQLQRYFYHHFHPSHYSRPHPHHNSSLLMHLPLPWPPSITISSFSFSPSCLSIARGILRLTMRAQMSETWVSRSLNSQAQLLSYQR